MFFISCFRPSDLSATAVASNNIVTLNNDQNIFESKKRIKTATSTEMEFKLTSKQRFSVAFNEILLALIANQVSGLFFFKIMFFEI